MNVHFMELATMRALRESGRLEEEPVEIEPLPGVRIRVRAMRGIPIVASLTSIVSRLEGLPVPPFELFGWRVEALYKGDPRSPWPDHWDETIEQNKAAFDRGQRGESASPVQRLEDGPSMAAVAAEEEGHPVHGWIAIPPPRVPIPEGKKYVVGLRLEDVLWTMFKAEPKYELAA